MTVRDGCDGIFDSRGGIKITVTTVTYRHVLSRKGGLSWEMCKYHRNYLCSCSAFTWLKMGAVRKKSSRDWRKNWTEWSCVTCMENLKLLRHRKNGNGREKSIWTDVECRRVSDGNSSLVIRTGAWHAPVDSRHGEIWKGEPCNERRKIRL